MKFLVLVRDIRVPTYFCDVCEWLMDISEEWIREVKRLFFQEFLFGASGQKFREKNGDP